jgi:cyclomaltodextrinase
MPVQFRHSVIYHILIDRFAGYSSDEWHKPYFLGGNIRGIIEKLGYLKDLGVSVLWLSPFYKTTAYHGYHVTDYFSMEPRFGSKQELSELIALAHDNEMKVIADFVPNHCSREHPFFQEALSSPHSRYRDWFFFQKWPHKYLRFHDVDALPKLNLTNPETAEHIIDAAKHWLSLGLDGFRLDHVVGLPRPFLERFEADTEREFPASLLIGEAWLSRVPFHLLKTINIKQKHMRWFLGIRQEDVQYEYNDLLDGVLDFRFRELVISHIAQSDHYREDHARLDELLRRHYASYPPGFFLPSFLDNHDLNRFLFECGNDREKLKQAVELQMSIEQPAIIYYGTEVGLTHDRAVDSSVPYSDLQARRIMPWGNRDTELLEFFKDCVRRRARRFS